MDYNFTNYYDAKSRLWIDFTNMNTPNSFFEENSTLTNSAYASMKELENGAIANPDENRMVGHYWLRNTKICTDKAISAEIESTIEDIKRFSEQVHSGEIKSSAGKVYTQLLVIGIGGSNLGPKFISSALNSSKMKLSFIDNTDPEGMDSVFISLKASLSETMVVVISKSGGTAETKNGMLECESYFNKNGVDFFKNAVCITQKGSKLEAYGGEKWLKMFPMWDFVGGRTSVLSAVGLLPLALQGVEIDALLEGAKHCDELSRNAQIMKNPSLIMALLWLKQSGGEGGTSMVMLPYKDSLELFSKYLQQLIMESLGKEYDLDGNKVHQGIAVYGNKGSTDQHSYVQQLVAGKDKMFVNFINVLKDREGESVIVGDNSTTGDYLNAFLQGTQKALTMADKSNMCITVPIVNAYYLGLLTALFERAVGYYASLVNINAYHQPAVEHGKKAANEVLAVKNKLLKELRDNKNESYTAKALAEKLGENELTVLNLLMHLAENECISREDNSSLWDMEFKV